MNNSEEQIKAQRFDLYGTGCTEVLTCEQMVEKNREDCKAIFAHAEKSGCEGTYVEVAKYNDGIRAWQRYAFRKFLGGELGDERDGQQSADAVAMWINERNIGRDAVVHLMPNYKGD